MLIVVCVLIVSVDVCVWMQSPLGQKSDIQVIFKSFQIYTSVWRCPNVLGMYLFFSAKYESLTKLEPTY